MEPHSFLFFKKGLYTRPVQSTKTTWDGLRLTQPYDVAIVGVGPAGSTVAKVVAEQGFRTIMLDRRSNVGIPIQCGELVPTPSEARRLFPHSKRMPQSVHVPLEFVTNKTQTIRLISPNGSPYEFPFEDNIVERGKFDQHLSQGAEDAGAEILLSSTVKERLPNNELIFRTNKSDRTLTRL